MLSLVGNVFQTCQTCLTCRNLPKRVPTCRDIQNQMSWKNTGSWENVVPKKMSYPCRLTYVASTSDIIFGNHHNCHIVTTIPTDNHRHKSNSSKKMMRCPFSLRLFFRPDKVSWLIVMFLVLAALNPCRPSSAYILREQRHSSPT